MTNRVYKVLLVDQNQEDIRTTREKLSNTQVSMFQISLADSLLSALNWLARASFDVALVDLDLPDSQGLETLSTIQRHAPGLPIVLQTSRAGELLAPKAVEMGAQDYLVKGAVTGDALVRVLSYAIARRRSSADQQTVESPKAIVAAWIGSKGGVGTTTLACYHALELAGQTGQRVLLVDLDVSGSSAAFLVKTTSEYGVADASMNLQRLDGEFWAGLVGANPTNIDLLQAPGAQRFDHTLNGERVRHVLRFVRGRYDRIVVDLGRLNALSLSLLEEMREIYVVTTAELPALFETSRILNRLLALGIAQEQVRLVLNRVSKAVPGLSSSKDLERALGYPVYASLGDYGAELAESYADGKFLSTGLHLRREIAQVTTKILGGTPKPPEGMLRGILRLARA